MNPFQYCIKMENKLFNAIASGSINLSRLEKNGKKIIGKKSGETWTNITLSIFDPPDSNLNNGSIWINQTKEEREQNKERIFIGNIRIYFKS